MARFSPPRFRAWLPLILGLAALPSAGLAQQTYTPYAITTLAGSPGASGYVNATGSAARFNQPVGVAVDGSGNVYVADNNSSPHAVRMIASGGVVTTLSTNSGGFGILGGIAIDAAGSNLYVTDKTAGVVDKVALSGGATSLFYTSSTSSNLEGLALDSTGNVYVADTGDASILKITSGGVGSTFSTAVANPVGVAVDSSGNVYVADGSAGVIRKITSGGSSSIYAGQITSAGTVDGPATSAEFSHLSGIAIDGSGNLFVTDSQTLVRKISSSGNVTSLAGNTIGPGSTDGTGNIARFNFSGSRPAGIAVDHSGNIYVADVGNNTIRQGSASSAIPPTITAQPQSQSVNSGSTATFTVTASGTGPFTYQWNSSGGAVSGATGSSFTTGAAGNYQVLVQGAGGSVFSDFATLTVNSTAAAPVFTIQPASQTAVVGANVTFMAAASNSPTFQWYFNSGVISGATIASYMLTGVTTAAAGNYTVVATNSGGTATSNAAVLTVTVVTPPSITAQPQSATVATGANVTFSVTAAGTAPLTYAWQKNGAAISGATGSSLSLSNVAAGDAAAYTVMVSNTYGSVQSASATLTVNPPVVVTGPSITTQPATQTDGAGSNVTLSVAATGTGTLTYQWYENGVAIAGATGPTLSFANVGVLSAGSYTVTVTDGNGATVTSAAAALGVSVSARLVNLSILSNIQGSLTMGFVNGGAGTNGLQSLLIRAVGPSIGPGTTFNVPGVMPDPTLTVVQQTNNTNSVRNAGWGSLLVNIPLIQAADSATGAFALTNTSSLDSALLATFPPAGGGYSATVTGASGDSGYALTEVYDADTTSYTPASPRLLNLSCLTAIPVSGSLDVGFVVTGTTSETLLVRVTGPSLAVAPFSLIGTMPDPKLSVHPSNVSAYPTAPTAANAGWGGSAQITAADGTVGAFALSSPTSKDSALLITVPPGVPYTAEVSSVSGAGGTVLVEIYEVP